MKLSLGYRFLRWIGKSERRANIIGIVIGLLLGVGGALFIDNLIKRYTCRRCGKLTER